MGVTSFYTGNGSYAQYCIAPEFSLYPMAQGMSAAEAMVMRNCSTVGVFAGAYGHEEMLVCHEELLALYTAGKLSLQPEVAQGLESVAEYLGRLERREIQGKVVVAIGDGF